MLHVPDIIGDRPLCQVLPGHASFEHLLWRSLDVVASGVCCCSDVSEFEAAEDLQRCQLDGFVLVLAVVVPLDAAEFGALGVVVVLLDFGLDFIPLLLVFELPELIEFAIDPLVVILELVGDSNASRESDILLVLLLLIADHGDYAIEFLQLF